MTTTHILLVEDDPAIATTLRYALEREGWDVTWLDTAGQVSGWLADFSQAAVLKDNDTPKVTSKDTPQAELSAIVLDVGLPDGNGFEVCQSVRFGQYYASVPILFLTARDDEIDKILGLEMGADDYITKPFSPREIVARLKAIWRRQQRQAVEIEAHFEEKLEQQLESRLGRSADSPVTSSPLSPWTNVATSVHVTQDFQKSLATGEWQYQDSIYQLSWNGVALPLSKTELGIMLALLAQPAHILSRDQILTAISDYPEHRLARTIDSHVKTLRYKLAEINPNVEVIVTHRGLGYGLNQQKC